ncbi:MAG TPA: outer membrane protein assembly factor BamE [Steroidobacteraceae bacterium]|nr:outer membrane protein assembly factor BamE [Steroidobacteraceae bacterium]
MNRPWSAIAAALVFCCFAMSVSGQNGTGEALAGAQIGVVRPRQAAKVIPGMSKAKVRSLLGAPWRTVQYNDEEEVENEIWEYRGEDSNGKFRIHIEFDRHEIVRIVGKIPDDVSGGKGTPAQSSSLQPLRERCIPPRFEDPTTA